MSSGLREECVEPAVEVWVVGHVVVPAAPEDPRPALGQDPCCVWVAAAAGSGPVIGVPGPGVGAWGVLCPVHEGCAELLVAATAVGDVEVFAGLPCGGCDAGSGGQGCGVGEPGAAVADLGQQGGCADNAGAGQGLKDRTVRVGQEGFLDPGLELLLLGAQGGEQVDESQHDDFAGFSCS